MTQYLWCWGAGTKSYHLAPSTSLTDVWRFPGKTIPYPSRGSMMGGQWINIRLMDVLKQGQMFALGAEELPQIVQQTHKCLVLSVVHGFQPLPQTTSVRKTPQMHLSTPPFCFEGPGTGKSGSGNRGRKTGSWAPHEI